MWRRYIDGLDDDSISAPENLDFQFKKYDSNSNGTIDKDELAGLIRGLGLEDMVPSIEEVREFGQEACHVRARSTNGAHTHEGAA